MDLVGRRWRGRRAKVLRAIRRGSGTSKELASRTAMPLYAVQFVLRDLVSADLVRRGTRWHGSLSYAFVYMAVVGR